MAEQLDMAGLNLNASQDGPPPPSTQRSSIPPHMRGRIPSPPQMGNPAPPAMSGLNNSAWAGYVGHRIFSIPFVAPSVSDIFVPHSFPIHSVLLLVLPCF